jgi:thiol-disulfide isomerase/thioredoxin
MKNFKYTLALLLGLMTTFTTVACSSNENSKKEASASQEQQNDIPDFMLIDLDGKQVNLQDFAGKKIFLNVWATWCPPCIREMPSIQKLYDSVDKEEVAIVLLSVDQNFGKVQPFMQARRLNMPAYGPAEQLPALFNTGSIPSTFIFDSTGKLVWKHVGMADYGSEEFKNFLGNKVQ